MSKVVAIAADHGGFELKAALLPELRQMGYEVLDLGTDSGDSVDYPDFAEAVTAAIREARATSGLLICGSGIGMSIAANRHRDIRAALCQDATTARLSRQHNDANVLVLGARLIGVEAAKDCVRTFFATAFDGGRHSRRIAKMS